MSEFYITLPSNTKVAGNKNNDFVVELPKKFQLMGAWEVGLSDISYPVSWNTVSDSIVDNAIVMRKLPGIDYKVGKNSIRTQNSPDYWGFKVQSGRYTSPEDLVKSINDQDFYTPDGPILSYNRLFNKITNIRPDVIFIGKSIQYQLGLENFPSKYEGKFTMDVTGGLNYLWIYCNLVQPQIVGDTMTDLLATVPIKVEQNSTINFMRFERPQFVPLKTHDFNSIRIEIKDHQDQLFPFQFGAVLIRLCFRKNNIFNR